MFAAFAKRPPRRARDGARDHATTASGSAFVSHPLLSARARRGALPQRARAAGRPTSRARARPAMSANDPLTYAAAGVDMDSESASIKALLGALGPVAQRARGRRGAAVAHAGGFSGLIEFGDSLLALCTDGVGSKLLLAGEMGAYDTVGIDCMAMNVNDLLCVGAEPLAFVDYIAAPRPSAAAWAALGRGLGEACRRARVSLCGGETASLPDMVREIDVSGTALGWVPKGAQLEGRVRRGDVVIGLPSSGMHSNGFSLVRKIVAQGGASLADAAPFDAGARADGLWRRHEGAVTLGEVLLNPTKIYVDPVWDLLDACRRGAGPCAYDDIHGIAHITGGGLSNLLRLGADLGFVIDNALPVLPEFAWLQQLGGISDFEMWRTFNMGMGMAVVVCKESGEAVSRWVAERLPGSRAVGFVDGERRVVEGARGVVFDRY